MDLDDVFIGEIRIFPFDFVPRGWLPCDGRKLPLSSNTALFSIIGTSFGGDGKVDFALPDLRGYVPMGTGDASPLGKTITAGQKLGSNTVTIDPDQMPRHSHGLQRKGATAFNQKTNSVGAGSCLAQLAVNYDGTNIELVPHLQANTPPTAQLHPLSIGIVGNGTPHENRQPFLALGYFIAMQGQYPTYD